VTSNNSKQNSEVAQSFPFLETLRLFVGPRLRAAESQAETLHCKVVNSCFLGELFGHPLTRPATRDTLSPKGAREKTHLIAASPPLRRLGGSVENSDMCMLEGF
jgi:hypothetical protein